MWSRHFYAFENKLGIRACVVTNFHPRMEKMSIIWKIWTIRPVLKFHLGLAKPSWKFNSVYGVGIFTWNCNAILKRSLLFTWDETATQYIELKFQPGLKISIYSPRWKSSFPTRVENLHNNQPLRNCTYCTLTIFIHNVKKWPNILWKSCEFRTIRFWKYVWKFCG